MSFWKYTSGRKSSATLTRSVSEEFLDPRLCLGSHCAAGSACRKHQWRTCTLRTSESFRPRRARPAVSVRSQAEPGNENRLGTEVVSLSFALDLASATRSLRGRIANNYDD